MTMLKDCSSTTTQTTNYTVGDNVSSAKYSAQSIAKEILSTCVYCTMQSLGLCNGCRTLVPTYYSATGHLVRTS